MSATSLIDLLNDDGGEVEAVGVELPEAIKKLRKAWPLNHMAANITRVEGKPSERVRLRGVIKDLRGEGLAITCFDDSDTDSKLSFGASFKQSGMVWDLHVSWTDPDSYDTRGVEVLARVQEILQGYNLPMIMLGGGRHQGWLRLADCEPERLIWAEMGLPEFWADEDLDFSAAIEWNNLIPNDGYSARSWLATGWEIEDAKPWIEAGCRSGSEAVGWTALGIPHLTPEMAMSLSRRAISFHTVQTVREMLNDELDLEAFNNPYGRRR